MSARAPEKPTHRRAAADFGYGLSAHTLGDMLVDAAAQFELIDLMLGEIADTADGLVARHACPPKSARGGSGDAAWRRSTCHCRSCLGAPMRSSVMQARGMRPDNGAPS